MSGYSGTPLWQKLGYQAGTVAYVVGVPANYRSALGLPPEVSVSWAKRLSAGIGFVHVFAASKTQLARQLARFRTTIAPDGVVWVSWPKKSSGVSTDITEDVIREIALPLGLVDIKVCAVNETWSGLKLVIRKELR